MKSFLQIVEETKKNSKPVVMAFGRMNPPTTGHMKLVDKVHEIAKKNGADHTIVVSHSQDAKKNPLSSEQKLKHLKRYSPKTNFTASSKEQPTILHHASKLYAAGHKHLIVVGGSDRVKEYHDLLHRYNGVTGSHGHYKFDKIEVKSAGQRDPDAEGTEGMSASKMREHAKNKDFGSFRQGVPAHVSDEHAKELMHDVRHGMGLKESVNYGDFKAIFITGGPGSGKDLIIREAIALERAVELNTLQAYDYLADKKKLYERSSDFRREAIRRRGPLIINGPAEQIEYVLYIREELNELGYETLMIFVETTDEASKLRNESHKRMMVESIRHDKWVKSQKNKEVFAESFRNLVVFDNTNSVDTKEQEIHDIYCSVNKFLESNISESAIDWLERKGKLNIGNIFNKYLKENKNDKKDSTKIQRDFGTIEEGRTRSRSSAADSSAFGSYSAGNTGDTGGRGNSAATYRRTGPRVDTSITPDNRASDPNDGNIKWDGNKKRGSYIFRTYSEAKNPTLTIKPQPKETNFSQDKEKLKKKGLVDSPTQNQRIRNTTGIGPEFDTRQQGTVYPMSGLGDVTYRESVSFKDFKNKVIEAIDDPGAVDMGVGGTLGGATNKEPIMSHKDNLISIEIKKKKKRG